MLAICKKYLLIVHRYFGFGLCLLFVMWFLSGFVMMYTEYPYLKENKKLQQIAEINLTESCITPDAAFSILKIKDTLTSAKVTTLLNRTVYRFQLKNESFVTVYADNGEKLNQIDSLLAKRIVFEFLKKEVQIQEMEIIYELDQWTPRNWFKLHLPMYRFTLSDKESTKLYVSSTTGEIVQMLTSQERFWAWLGPIPHWIYFRDLIVNRPVWRQVVIWTSLLGVILSITGIILGIIRYKKNRNDKTKVIFNFSPYKKKWFRWHHYIGFVFGTFVFTWVFSGLLSMNPMRWSPDTNLSENEMHIWTGGNLNLQAFKLSPQSVLKQNSLREIKEMQLFQFQGIPYYKIINGDNSTKLIKASDTSALIIDSFSNLELISAIYKLNSNNKIIEQTLLTDYDVYYYSKHRDKALPVLRVKINDPDKTWLYINPKTSEIAYKYQNLSRLERWLYNGLHSWDYSFLLYKRPLWDIIMIILLLGGLAVSTTGMVLTFKCLKRKKNKNKNGNTTT